MRKFLFKIITTLSIIGFSACQAEVKLTDEIDCSSEGSHEVWERITFYADGTAILNYYPDDGSGGTISKGVVFSKNENTLVLYSALNDKGSHCRWEFDALLTSAKFQCGASPITKLDPENAINALTCKKI